MLADEFCWILLPAVAAGMVQGLAGFGSGFITLMFFPALLGMVASASIMQCISIFTCMFIAMQYRGSINLKLIWKPLIFYFPSYLLFMRLLSGLDTTTLSLLLGLIMIGVSVYSNAFQEKLTFRPTLLAASICAVSAGAIDAFLGIGGITIVIYLLAAAKEKEEFLGTAQFFFLITCTYGTIVRFSNGLFTLEMVPYAFLALAGLLMGVFISSIIVKRIRTEQVKRFTYLFMGFAGCVITIKNLLILLNA